jgi:hypothetical protein
MSLLVFNLRCAFSWLLHRDLALGLGIWCLRRYEKGHWHWLFKVDFVYLSKKKTIGKLSFRQW